MRAFRTMLATAMLAAGLLSPPNAWACTCAAPSVVDQWRDADAIFSGVVIDRFDPLGDDDTRSTGDPIRWTFDVDVSLRGGVGDPQDVWSARDDASCGYEFEEGRRYLVFASVHPDGIEDIVPPNALWTNICDGTFSIP